MHLRRSVIFSSLFILGTTARANAPWDLEADWSPPGNPNGTWSYGQYDGGSWVGPAVTPGSSYVGGSFSPDEYLSAGQGYYVTNTANPFGGSFVYLNNWTTPEWGLSVGAVSLDEIGSGSPAVVWTAPASGLYDVSVEIGGSQAYMPGGYWDGTWGSPVGGYGNQYSSFSEVFVNGALESDSGLANNVKSWAIDNLYLSAGSKVMAIVPYCGPNGTDNQTYFHVNAVPEPAPVIAVALGSLGLLAKRKRR